MKVFFALLLGYLGFASWFGVNGFLTRTLGLEGYGNFRVGTSLAAILGVAVLAGGHALARKYIPRYARKERWDLVHGFVQHHLRLAAFLGFGLLLLLLGLITAFTDYGLARSAHEALVAAVLTPVTAVSLLFGALIQSLGKQASSIYPYEVIRPLVFWLSCFVWLTQFGKLTEIDALMLMSAALAVVVLIQLLILKRAAPRFSIRLAPSAYQIPIWTRVGMPLLVASLANQMLVRIDVITLELLGSSETEVGAFALLLFLAQPLWLNADSVNIVVGPMVSRRASDLKRLQRLFDRSARILFTINLIAAVLLLLIARRLLVWFDASLEDYLPWLRALVVVTALCSTAWIASPLLNAAGAYRQAAAWSLRLLLILVIAMPLGVALFGLRGALCVSMLTSLAMSSAYLFLLKRRLGLELLSPLKWHPSHHPKQPKN